jgi:hypothetical protein
VTLAERPRSLTIPDEAVFSEGGGNFVYVVNPDSTVARTTLTLGSRDSSRVEVLHGLEDGQVVVRTGHQKLFPGAKVMPISDLTAMAAGGAAAGAGAAHADAPPPAGAAAHDTSTRAKAAGTRSGSSRR